jgi:hypothetical protein
VYQGSACSFGANRRQARNDSRESAGAFCRLSATIPAARVQKEASGFSESLEGNLWGTPTGTHEKVHRSSGYRHLAHNADGHPLFPAVARQPDAVLLFSLRAVPTTAASPWRQTKPV